MHSKILRIFQKFSMHSSFAACKRFSEHFRKSQCIQKILNAFYHFSVFQKFLHSQMKEKCISDALTFFNKEITKLLVIQSNRLLISMSDIAHKNMNGWIQTQRTSLLTHKNMCESVTEISNFFILSRQGVKGVAEVKKFGLSNSI